MCAIIAEWSRQLLDPSAVVAIAGRRIDAPDAAETRFPLANCPQVRAKLESFLKSANVELVVCSAASGADLLALEIAASVGIRKWIVLPFDQSTFRRASVVDSPGNWGASFDRVISQLSDSDHLEVLPGNPKPDNAFTAVNQTIVDRAVGAARYRMPTGQAPSAVVIWEGRSRGPGDMTADFLTRALKAGLTAYEIRTIPSGLSIDRPDAACL